MLGNTIIFIIHNNRDINNDIHYEKWKKCIKPKCEYHVIPEYLFIIVKNTVNDIEYQINLYKKIFPDMEILIQFSTLDNNIDDILNIINGIFYPCIVISDMLETKNIKLFRPSFVNYHISTLNIYI